MKKAYVVEIEEEKTIYTWKEIARRGDHYIPINYSENPTRILKKCIEVNGMLLLGVDKIYAKVSCDKRLVTIKFLNIDEKEIGSHTLKIKESLVVDSTGYTPTYSFVEVA